MVIVSGRSRQSDLEMRYGGRGLANRLDVQLVLTDDDTIHAGLVYTLRLSHTSHGLRFTFVSLKPVSFIFIFIPCCPNHP